MKSQEAEAQVAEAPPKENTYPSKKLGRNPERKRYGARNQHRHKSFVKWLLGRFPFLQDADDERHVLDVAGGKGEVSARMTMCHRKKVVMIDPRPADILHCFETLVLPKIPNKWQRRLEQQREADPTFLEETINSRFKQLVTMFSLEHINSSQELQDSIENASLLLGLHADGATEAVVDAALEYQKPFVVVPCCVFPNLFQERRVANDEGTMVPVRSHEQFCKYLKAKDERFQVEILPFEGRNVAIWWDGQ